MDTRPDSAMSDWDRPPESASLSPSMRSTNPYRPLSSVVLPPAASLNPFTGGRLSPSDPSSPLLSATSPLSPSSAPSARLMIETDGSTGLKQDEKLAASMRNEVVEFQPKVGRDRADSVRAVYT